MKKFFALIFFALIFFAANNNLSAEETTKKAVINVPTPCHKADKIDNNKIYLVSGDKACIQVISKITVDLHKDIKSVFVYSDGKFWREQKIEDFDTDTVNELMEKTKKQAENLKVPENTHQKEMEKSAKDAYDYYKSDNFQNKLATETNRLKETVFSKVFKEYYKDSFPDDKQQSKGTLANTERLYLFISSSVPKDTLRNYISDIDYIDSSNIYVVMRGFVGGMTKIRPMMDFIGSITSKNPGCAPEKCELYNANIIVDPMLFRRYQITQVPALVYVPSISIFDADGSEGMAEHAGVSDYYVIYGDAPIAYSLGVINKEVRKASLEGITEIFRKGK